MIDTSLSGQRIPRLTHTRAAQANTPICNGKDRFSGLTWRTYELHPCESIVVAI